jgi:16S rRNA (cytidine1402-2'-O)-methyltransferase
MGPLYVVSTPIGNCADIGDRAKQVLADADYILAEDTRVSGRMLSMVLGRHPPLKSCHDHNEEAVAPLAISWLKEGKTVALISDSGTPGIADPAYRIVRAALAEGVRVVPVPGPSAITAALVCSGLPTDRFIFENFLPPKSSRRLRLFEGLREERRTVVAFETPHRIEKVLREMEETLGDVHVVIGRELTKMHEEFLRGTPRSLLEHFGLHAPRGEMVVVFNTRVRGETPRFEQRGGPEEPPEAERPAGAQ